MTKPMQSQKQIAIEGRKEGGRSQFTQTKKAKANQTSSPRKRPPQKQKHH